MSVDLLDPSLGGELVERPTILLVDDDPQIRESSRDSSAPSAIAC